jgi:hypothetical protein
MKELLRTDDIVFLSWLRARLEGEGIDAFVFDDKTSGAFVGVLDAVGQRVMVDDRDFSRAQHILDEGRRMADDG